MAHSIKMAACSIIYGSRYVLQAHNYPPNQNIVGKRNMFYSTLSSLTLCSLNISSQCNLRASIQHILCFYCIYCYTICKTGEKFQLTSISSVNQSWIHFNVYVHSHGHSDAATNNLHWRSYQRYNTLQRHPLVFKQFHPCEYAVSYNYCAQQLEHYTLKNQILAMPQGRRTIKGSHLFIGIGNSLLNGDLITNKASGQIAYFGKEILTEEAPLPFTITMTDVSSGVLHHYFGRWVLLKC